MTPEAAAPMAARVSRASSGARAVALARRLGGAALDLVYPPSCLSCRAAVTTTGALCAACWTQVRFIERPYCERLGTPFAQDLGAGLLSPDAIADPPVWRRARAAAIYEDGPAKALVHRLKYYDRLDVALPMGRWMARAGAELLNEADALIPAPLHRWRLAGRRFNQAMALADVISAETGVPVEPLALERVKATSPQVGLSRSRRATNMQGAFRVSAEGQPRIAGRRLILIDDVLTSGATSNAAARILLRAGAASVDLLVFARVVAAS